MKGIEKQEVFNSKPLFMAIEQGIGEVVFAHWHSHYEIIEVIEGAPTVTVGDNSYKANIGDIFFVNSGLCHEVSSDAFAKIRAVVMQANEVSDNFYTTMLLANNNSAHLTDTANLRTILDCLFDEYNQNKAFSQDAMHAYLRLAEIHIMRNYNVLKSDKPAYINLCKQAIQFMHKHYGDKIELEDIALSVNLSKYHFSRIFKEITHCSPMQYLTLLRIRSAIELMQNTNYNMTEISHTCGFSTPNYFNTAFKSFTNLTPKKYKSQLN